MTFPDGDSYVGEWKDGNMNGWGAYYWNNGNSYQVSVSQHKIVHYEHFTSFNHKTNSINSRSNRLFYDMVTRYVMVLAPKLRN